MTDPERIMGVIVPRAGPLSYYCNRIRASLAEPRTRDTLTRKLDSSLIVGDLINQACGASRAKVFTGVAVGLPGLFMVALSFLGHDRVWSVAIFTGALTVNGAVTPGYLANGLDIAPNFSGTIFGMANTLSSLGGWLSTLMVGEVTKSHETFERWQIVFFILAGTYTLGALTFVLLGSGNRQPWNSPREEECSEKREMQPLNDHKV
ncbi:Putative inorganic phosphate cotransporter [Eumeta japonica]|uniref:Inorganic phosphate cotransporter n=1 Tax=Eumeta variegata TaxID=151549 RepID=A0A4C1Z1I2_EUMVA|nr:Putative inorganic phosphate cotransporter [Eumeta japonica]